MEGLAGEGMEGQMDVWKINPYVLQDIDPLDPLCAAQIGKTFMTLHTLSCSMNYISVSHETLSSSIPMKVHPYVHRPEYRQ